MSKPLVLIVDDEVDVAKEITRIVTKTGEFEVDTAFSGEEAVSKLKEKDFDVVLLDIRMPKMSGIETLKEIYKLRRNIEVIMVTALDDAQTAWEVSKVGAFDYITKPFKNEALILRVRMAAQRKKEKLKDQEKFKEMNEFLNLKSDDPKEYSKILEEWSKYRERKGGSLFLGPEEIKFVMNRRKENPRWYEQD